MHRKCWEWSFLSYVSLLSLIGILTTHKKWKWRRETDARSGCDMRGIQESLLDSVDSLTISSVRSVVSWTPCGVVIVMKVSSASKICLMAVGLVLIACNVVCIAWLFVAKVRTFLALPCFLISVILPPKESFISSWCHLLFECTIWTCPGSKSTDMTGVKVAL